MSTIYALKGYLLIMNTIRFERDGNSLVLALPEVPTFHAPPKPHNVDYPTNPQDFAGAAAADDFLEDPVSLPWASTMMVSLNPSLEPTGV